MIELVLIRARADSVVSAICPLTAASTYEVHRLG